MGGFASFPPPPPARFADIIEVQPRKPPKRAPKLSDMESKKSGASRKRRASVGSISVLEWMTGKKKHVVTKEEEEELRVVDFKAFFEEKAKIVDKMVRWTNASDLQNDIVALISDHDSSGSDSDSDSDSDSSSDSDDD